MTIEPSIIVRKLSAQQKLTQLSTERGYINMNRYGRSSINIKGGCNKKQNSKEPTTLLFIKLVRE